MDKPTITRTVLCPSSLLDYEAFEKSERRFWLDEGTEVIADGNGVRPAFRAAGGDWTSEGNWAEGEDERRAKVHTSSFEWCKRVLRLNLLALQGMQIPRERMVRLEFDLKVQGTPPKTNDPFTVYVQQRLTTRSWPVMRSAVKLM